MRWLESPATVALACGLIVITNLGLLGAAAWNRRGGPEAELTLTERELAAPPARQDEDSGLLLSLVLAHETPRNVQRTARWRRYELPDVEYAWLDREKLRELGFRVDMEPSDPAAEDHYRHAMARRAWVVLEQDGPAWSRWLEGREQSVQELRRRVEEGTAEASGLAEAEAVLALDRTMRSRLVPVDAGTDPAALRRRHPDRSRYAVVEALFRPQMVQPDEGPPYLRGVVAGLVVRQVHVPREFRGRFQPFLPEGSWEEIEMRVRDEARTGWPSPVPPRYRAVLAFGARHQPWLAEAETIEADAG